jgi:hypothetical protein
MIMKEMGGSWVEANLIRNFHLFGKFFARGTRKKRVVQLPGERILSSCGTTALSEALKKRRATALANSAIAAPFRNFDTRPAA